jgi:hypothetical protein
MLAHRLAYEFVNGKIPQGMLACHHCDNRKCCNPEHIFIGTQKDNLYDMIDKGRSDFTFGGVRPTPVSGDKHHFRLHPENSPLAKLTLQQVVEVRNRRASGEMLKSIGNDYNITEGAVSKIVRGLAYPLVGGPICPGRKSPNVMALPKEQNMPFEQAPACGVAP